MSQHTREIVNFGRNISFEPQVFAAPRSEAEVLQLMKQYAGRKFRVIGRLHSWSATPSGKDIVLDLRHLNEVKTEQRDGGIWATIGAGCQIKRVLSELERQAGVTTPSLGLITEQALAGAMATGTHGSGKHSLSHYASEIRIAQYDETTGEPMIRTIKEGSELRAARCSLGCLGIILSVGLWARPQYNVEESFRKHDTLEEVIASELATPLQQFYLMPWSWSFYGQHRREVALPRSTFASAYRWYFFVTFDIGMHVVLLFLLRWMKSRAAIKAFFRWIIPFTVIRGWRVVDKSCDMLIMEHELFVHIETEVFVKRSQLAKALEVTKELIRHFDGETSALSAATRDKLTSLGLLDDLNAKAGTYTHHYPICVRRILPDDTLISMASSNDEDYYSISIVSCARPTEREGLFHFSSSLAAISAALFGGRLHWGKHCPTDFKTIETLYPHLKEFQSICNAFDSKAVFRNDWANQLLFETTSQKDA